MTATFNPALTDQVSQVRQLVGDTNVAKAQVQDETISFYLGQGFTVLKAAGQIVRGFAAEWTRKAVVATVDEQRQDFTRVAAGYLELAKSLESQQPLATPDAAAAGGIYVGGIGDCRGPLDDCCPGEPSPAWRYPIW